ncbi:hypothetical protein [Delftia sp. HK171]|uniref:hypothetical protein n=1 Tax=Delftia sp. HK171 TaxID=1920191 RepID=UPI0012EC45EC|nr:hypothetical protein [Delftia sp. HK171]
MKNYSGIHFYYLEWKTSSELFSIFNKSQKQDKKYFRQDEVRDSINIETILSSLRKININKSSRFYKSLKEFNSINAIIKKYEKLNSYQIWMMSELSEISTIINALSDFDNKDYKSNLIDAVNGVPFINEEKTNGNNIARNKIFELNVAAKLKKSGFGVVLGNTKEDGSIDVSASSGENDFFIECKRIQTIESLTRNIKKAISQLNLKRIEKNKSIVALDFTKVFWKEYLDNGNKIPNGEVEARKILEIAENSYYKILTEEYMMDLNKVLLFLCHIRIPLNKTSSGPKFQRHFFTIRGNNTNKINLQIFRDQLRKY